LRLAGQQESILCTLGPTYCLVHFVLESAGQNGLKPFNNVPCLLFNL
jgi:hypothetical protein